MERIELALQYRRKCWSVIPLKENAKQPKIIWEEFQHRLASEEEIREWWTQWPNANIGIVTGGISGNLCGLDVDPRNGGSVEGLEIPLTPTVNTGGGGRHYYFVAPVGTKSTTLGKGIDFQAEGKYVVAPGSVHESGKSYEWAPNLGLDLSLKPLPDWIVSTVKDQSKTGFKSSITTMLEGVSEGQRNNTAASLAGYYFGLGIPADIVLANLRNWNRVNHPPLTDDELTQIVNSIERRAQSAQVENQEIKSESLRDLLSEAEEPVDWLVDSLFAAKTIGYIAGDGKVGKSWLSLYLALCMSTGRSVFGQFDVPKKRKVLLIQEEDSRGMVKNRIDAIIAGNGLKKPETDDFRCLIRTGFKLDQESGPKLLERELMTHRPDVVIIDVFSKVHSLNENDAVDMSKIMSVLEGARRVHGCAVIVLHHFRKSTGMGQSRKGSQMLRGSTLLSGWAENSLFVTSSGKDRRVEIESKFTSLDPFIYAFEDVKDGSKGMRFTYKGDAGLSRAKENLDKLLTAIEEQFESNGAMGCTAKALSEVAGMSENSIKKHGDVLFEAGKIQITKTSGDSGRKAKCFIPVTNTEKGGEPVTA